ncbi:UNVERIFIED_CONTAM: hypothetical protein GTU68_031616 [Idotea baltica]|nr:hypothetical protein [Idotea baltica]
MVDILNKKGQFDANVIIVKPTPRGDYTALRNQNGQYHILTKGIQEGELISDTHKVTSIREVIHPYNNWSRYLESAEKDSIRFIISNTTESGIKYSDEKLESNTCPKEFPAKLTRWLYHRWLHFDGAADKGCIFLPCELIEDNGTVLKDCILQHITNWNLQDGFKEWILNSNYFCNTLVDRIVPGKPLKASENEMLNKDELLVMAEPYHLWAIEGPEQVRHELPVEGSGLNIVFTDDLSPYRKLKVRILNGAHTAMVPVGYLAGIETVREALEDPEVGVFIKELLYQEILPTIDYPKEKLEAYIESTLDRFRNPFVDHQLLSISLNSISKFRYRLLPSLLDYIAKFNSLPDRITSSFAALIVFYLGKHNYSSIPRNDSAHTLEFFDNLQQELEAGKNITDIISCTLAHQEFWGQDLNQIYGLQSALSKKVQALKNK